MKKHARPNDQNSTQRPWHDLKPGDVIWFATGWYEIFDAYPSGRDTVTVKLRVHAHGPAPAHIETHRVRIQGTRATCKA